MELLKKLRIDTSRPVYVLHAPADVATILEGADWKKPGRTAPVDQLVCFAQDGAALLQLIPALEKYVAPHTLLWICYPKQSGSMASDLIKMAPWQPLFDAGFRGQTSVSVNEDWTGMRFTNAPQKKPSKADVPMEKRKVPGIDYRNRTAALPQDAEEALAALPGLLEFFNALSFSHKREHIEAIEDAKKPETRARRIGKMVEMLLKMRAEKALRGR